MSIAFEYLQNTTCNEIILHINNDNGYNNGFENYFAENGEVFLNNLYISCIDGKRYTKKEADKLGLNHDKLFSIYDSGTSVWINNV